MRWRCGDLGSSSDNVRMSTHTATRVHDKIGSCGGNADHRRSTPLRVFIVCIVHPVLPLPSLHESSLHSSSLAIEDHRWLDHPSLAIDHRWLGHLENGTDVYLSSCSVLVCEHTSTCSVRISWRAYPPLQSIKHAVSKFVNTSEYDKHDSPCIQATLQPPTKIVV